MSEGNQDARLQELAFLAKVEREGVITFVEGYPPPTAAQPGSRHMIVHLLYEGCLNGLGYIDVRPEMVGETSGGRVILDKRYEDEFWRDIALALSGQHSILRISHKGRMRRSELEQALRSGRDREPFGILWDSRHLRQAVAIAVLSAARDSPLSLAYLDMNGLKAINDRHGHHAGDAAIRAYMHTVAMFIEGAEGFRGSRADEVVVVMRDTAVAKARDTMMAVLKQLQKERVLVDGKEIAPCLTASCGIASTPNPGEDPEALLKRADAALARAKEKSQTDPRSNALAVEDKEVEVLPPPDALRPGPAS